MVDAKSTSDDDDTSEEEVQQETQEELNKKLLDAVKKDGSGDLKAAEEAIKKGADVYCEDNGWNPLLWAACNGNEAIVRLLIQHRAHDKYLENDKEVNEGHGDEEEEKDNFKPVPDPAKTGRHTPMHWASYHGHIKVVWLLMKVKMNPLLMDIHGNNCIHQAAANSQLGILKCFMSDGVDLTIKNARVHTPLDLATDPATKKLIKRGIKTTNCKGTKCKGSKFDFRNIQFYCENCGDFYCKLCSSKSWVFEHKDSEKEERPVCRCDNCLSIITKAERDLKTAMDTQDFHTLDRVYNTIKTAKTDIDVKLFNAAEVLHLKLEKELDIRNFINSLAHVDNYKTIKKSVKVLNEKFKNAEQLGVIIAPELIGDINQCSKRLISERNLRFEMENMYVSASTKKTVKMLQDLIDLATQY